MTTRDLLLGAVAGLLAGSHAAIWGMYKDAIHEGFSWPRFSRSVLVGTGAGIVVQSAFHVDASVAATLVVLFGLAYALERGVVEVWKTFVRDEDQSKYTIPMQFAIAGAPVRSRAIRLAAGVLYVGVVALLLTSIARLDAMSPGLSTAMSAAIAGGCVGLVIAIGGGWKDAPSEGFDPAKFLRSPLLCVAWALVVSRLTSDTLTIAIAAIGYERASAETWKTFCFPSKPRGKFAGKPVLHPEMLVRRRWFVPAYVAIWVVVLACGALALRDGAPAERAFVDRDRR